MAIFSSCFLAEHSGRPTSRLPTAFCLAPHGPVIITRPTRLATFPFMPCVAHFRPPLLCPRGYLWRQSCDWSSIWSTFGKLRSREAGKQLLDGIWAIQNQLDNKWGQSNQSCRSKAFIDQLQDAGSRWAIKDSVTVPLFVFLYLIWQIWQPCAIVSRAGLSIQSPCPTPTLILYKASAQADCLSGNHIYRVAMPHLSLYDNCSITYSVRNAFSDKVCNKQDKTVMNIWVLEHPKVSKLWPYICT